MTRLEAMALIAVSALLWSCGWWIGSQQCRERCGSTELVPQPEPPGDVDKEPWPPEPEGVLL